MERQRLAGVLVLHIPGDGVVSLLSLISRPPKTFPRICNLYTPIR
jgi:hypothetical protein